MRSTVDETDIQQRYSKRRSNRDCSSILRSNHRRWALVCLLAMANVLQMADGCYLKNCPLGKREGKRSRSIFPQIMQTIKPCPRCSAGGEGQCVGPQTCCSDRGCYIGNEAASCMLEVESPIACVPDGPRCSLDGELDGVCASDGVCCNEDGCSIMAQCLTDRLYLGKDT